MMPIEHPITRPPGDGWRSMLNFAGGILWHAPGSFQLARALGPQYSLRCVLFHDISDTESAFTKGLGSTISLKNFERALKFVIKNYSPVSLQDVLDSFNGRILPPRPMLVTFDDTYRSVREFAAPLCSKFGVPAVFFVSASCLDNRQLALDNLVCYVANVHGMDTLSTAANFASGRRDINLRSLTEVFAGFLPAISLGAREVFRRALLQLMQTSEGDLAAKAGLYLTSAQLRDLASFNFEMGNHTYNHVHCRSLSANDFAEEVDKNKALLEGVLGRTVRSFSVPYGSSTDLTSDLVKHLRSFGYEAIFLSESRVNPPHPDPFRLNRVSLKTAGDGALFSEIEILPRLRVMRSSLFGGANAEPYFSKPTISS
jgi:peptidoglycan/xylan/chitin deacetylase (PgdA/CDA1 family)